MTLSQSVRILVGVMTVLSVSAAGAAQTQAQAQAPAPAPAPVSAKPNPSWEKMKSLVGSWEGHEGDRPVSVTYTLVSNGMSLMENLNGSEGGHDMNMITMYAPDGDAVVATHYCAMGNQPRMRAASAGAGGDAKKLDFQFVDATNYQEGNPVMRRLVVTLQDGDHFQQAWTFRQKGADQTSDFVYTRKK